MFRKILVTGVLVCGFSLTGMVSASATEVTPEPETSSTVTLKWVLPDGGTAENVTWPQPAYTGQVPACDTSLVLQVDTYRYNTEAEVAAVDALDDDGLLTNGEDHAYTISWYFETVTGPVCEIVPETPVVVTPPPVVVPETPVVTPPPAVIVPPVVVPETPVVVTPPPVQFEQLAATGPAEDRQQAELGWLGGFLLGVGGLLVFVAIMSKLDK